MMNPLNGNKYLNRDIFIWFAGLVIILFGMSMVVSNNASSSVNELKVEVSAIKTDVNWIRDAMQKNPSSLQSAVQYDKNN